MNFTLISIRDIIMTFYLQLLGINLNHIKEDIGDPLISSEKN